MIDNASRQPRSARATVYLVLTVLGLLSPLVLGAVFVADHGLDFGELIDQTFSNTMSTLLLCDLQIASLAFWAWLSQEAPRIGIRRWWPFVVVNLLIGLSFALPLFMYLRETRRPAGPAPA